jgi:hypothetical protein
MGGSPQNWSFNSAGIAQLVRSAEKLIAANNFRLALEQLSVAQTLDPKNAYIRAIIDRVQQLQGSSHANKSTSQNPLSVSLGATASGGFPDLQPDITLSPKELQVRVKQLTNIAEKYLEEGSPDKAFDSLMRAFLLDPISPYVVACEKAVLPIWERNQTREGNSENPIDRNREKQSMNPPVLDPTPSPLPEPLKSKLEQEERLNLLRQKKDAERQEIERERWREASSPLKTFGTTQQKDSPGTSPPAGEDQPKEKGGLFTKLKRGKFLG